MRGTLQQGINKTRSVLRSILLTKLYQRSIGTHGCERMARMLVQEGAARRHPERNMRNSSIVKQLMSIKIRQAKEEEDREGKEYHRSKKKLWKTIPWTSRVGEEFRIVLRAEMANIWQSGKQKVWQKINHLTNIYGDNKVTDTIRDIKISDVALGEDRPQQPPFVAPGIENITESVKTVLQLPPKTTIYSPIQMEEVEVKIQEALHKARWELRGREERKKKRQTENEAIEERVDELIVLDKEKKKLDLTKIRVTDLPMCPEVILPDPRPEDEEMQLQSFKNNVLQAVEEYRREKCDSKGRIRKKNLSTSVMQGVKELQERKKKGDIIVTSDKSQRLCLMTEHEYITAAQPHIKNDRIINERLVKEKEELLNCHAVQFARIVGLCARKRTDRRLKTALTNSNIKPPPLYCLVKDHKQIVPNQPIPTRPVCGATESHTAQLGYQLTIILNAVADLLCEQLTTESDSTEDVIANMEMLNVRIQEEKIDNVVLLSSDVKALYPSLKVEESAAITAKMVVESGIKVEKFEWREAALYLALTRTKEKRDEIEEMMPGIMPKRKKLCGAHPGIKTSEIRRPLEDMKNEKTLFIPGNRTPTNNEKRQLLAKCIETALTACMKNHAYTFCTDSHLQEEGGSIGERFTQALARIVMLHWDQQFQRLAQQNNIKMLMYKRYVDDINQAVVALPLGTRWRKEEKKMVIEEDLIENDREIPADKRTLRELIHMGNSINTMIQLTGECPSSSPDGKMPMLDLACWVGEDGTIWWQHYRKPISNYLVMLNCSAMPMKVKRTVMAREVIRILRNCRKDMLWLEKASFLTDFCARMKASGYSERFREQIIMSGLIGFDKMIEVDEAGGRPLNRTRAWEAMSRKKAQLAKTITWHKRGGFDVPLFVPGTPGSELAKTIAQLQENSGHNRCVRFKIVETGGISLKSTLQKSDPWAGKKCGRTECFPCLADNGGDCKRSGVTYKILCHECGKRGVVSQYYGETSRNMFSRGREHLHLLHKKSEQSALWVHCRDVHNSLMVNFSMELTGTFSDALSRQVTEGVQIRTFKGHSMNRKSEWRQPAVTRTVFTRQLSDQ